MGNGASYTYLANSPLVGRALVKPASTWVEVPHAELDCSRRKRAFALRLRDLGVSRMRLNRQAVMKMNHIK